MNEAITAVELTNLINEINEINDFDLAWHWTGHSSTPEIMVYEEADRHELCGGTLENIQERILNALPAWGLTYHRDPIGRMKT